MWLVYRFVANKQPNIKLNDAQKYHSGTMCTGVFIELAGIQLSGWFKKSGSKQTK